MSEFFVTAKYQMKLPAGVDGVAGGLIIPAGISYHGLAHRTLEKSYPHLKRRLLDPQLYLAELNAASCRKACTKLASYGWFPLTKAIPFDSKRATQKEWAAKVEAIIETAWTGKTPDTPKAIDDCIRVCIKTQADLGVEGIILPSPLTQNAFTTYAAELDWLERGLALAPKIAPDVPIYATIAISDVTLRGQDPQKNGLVSLILDQLTARGVFGVYLVPVMASEDSYYFTDLKAVGAILRLCNGLKAGGVKRVIVGFAGTLGLPCLALGADVWASGWYRSERRMRLADFESTGGRVVPAYYSHPLGGEIHTENDLDKMVTNGFLDDIKDETVASQGLLKALGAKRKVATVPEWAYAFGNKAASTEHFVRVAIRETAAMQALAMKDQRARAGKALETAYQLSSRLQQHGPYNPRTSLGHQFGWNSAFQTALKNAY